MQGSYVVPDGLGEPLSLVEGALMSGGYEPAREPESPSEQQTAPGSFRALFENNPDAIVVTDSSGAVTDANIVAQKLSGYTACELRCMRFVDLFAESARPRAAMFLSRVLSGAPRTADLPALRKDQTRVDVSLTAALIPGVGRVSGIFCTLRDISRQMRIETELRQNCQDAERAKDRFLAVLSHELRTPLMPVLTTVQMLESHTEVPGDIRDMLGMMRRNLELEARLIDDLLDLNRIRHGKLTLYLQNTDVNAKIRSVIDLCQSDIHEKRLKLRMELDAADHCLALDPARVQQMLWNVIGNAVKFTPTGGTITIRTCNGAADRPKECCADSSKPCTSMRHGEQCPDEVFAVHVIDSGVGIAPEEIERLFQAFERSGSDGGSCFGGAGVGLAISRALMELHGGKLLAHSDGRGKGAVFTLLFPRRRMTMVNEPRPAIPRPPRHADRQHRVLLVEDHSDTARVLTHLLKGAGFNVTVAHSVQAAIAASQKHEFDLLISDIGLPDGTGADVVRHMHQKSRIPAIALSGYGMEDDIRRSRDAGFSDHLVKPINVQQLEATIDRLLATK